MSFVSVMSPKLSLPLLATSLLLTGITASALAADGDTVQTMIVTTRGLDLRSHAGQVQMQQRIEAATRRVCGSFDVRDLHDTSDYEACRAAATANASEQVQILVARAGGGPITVADTSTSHW